jgi:hypothetical protein
MLHQAMCLYQVVVAGEEVAFVISKGGKYMMYFLQLQVCW